MRTIQKFFEKIHLSVVDAKYLSEQAANANTKSVLLFFSLLFLFSLTISSIPRTAKITKFAPDILASAIGILKFENYSLISPDTIKSVDGWRLKELGALISGVSIPQSVTYPIKITVGTDNITAAKSPFIHIGKDAFSTNIISAMLQNKPDDIQNVSWSKILQSPNTIVDAEFYKAQLSKIKNKTNIFFAEFAIIGMEMFSAIFQIWISILIYLIFFGRKLNFAGRFRLIMFATIPYFILMPISIAAANNISFTPDIALIGGLIMTVRAVMQFDLNLLKGQSSEAR